jgi:hypothetical protein
MASSLNHYEEVGPAVEEALRTLDRHQQRRQQGVPTLSVIPGDVDAAPIVRRWAAAKGRTIAVASQAEALDAIARWFDALAETHDLTAAAYMWLARRAGGDAEKLALNRQSRSTHEQELFLDRLFAHAAISPVDLFCRRLIEHSCESGLAAGGVWDRLQTVFKGDMGGLCGGILAMLKPEPTPLLYVTLSSAVSFEQLRSFFDALAAVVCAAPRLSIVVSMGGVAFAGYLTGTPECRALALVREGMIGFSPGPPSLSGPACGPSAAALEGEFLATRVSPWGDLPKSSTLNDVATSRRDDPARSTAERYLFERLQTHPETAGLFELNGHLDCAGKGAMEIDLLARGARVAVEIDGYYHFNDPEAYRRDRRKDLQLQHVGYFVVRCLADDVVSRLEEILESILAAVRRQGQSLKLVAAPNTLEQS